MDAMHKAPEQEPDMVQDVALVPGEVLELDAVDNRGAVAEPDVEDNKGETQSEVEVCDQDAVPVPEQQQAAPIWLQLIVYEQLFSCALLYFLIF